ncbi:MAG TPA: type IV secretion system protein [Steroidobacteraceae bacterium]|jgi:type IV secretion system protein VirB5
MRKSAWVSILVCLLACSAGIPGAHAQWAVVDAPAIVQLIQQVQETEQEIETARSQLAQAQQALQTMTGNRGMQSLLSGTVRNYLPPQWSQFTTAASGAGAYPALSGEMQGALASNAILSSQQMSSLSPPGQQLIQGARQSNALRIAVAHLALANASSRFAALQSLISSISAANDQKGILDLQARINAELGMLQNEQTKLHALAQSSDAEDLVLKTQLREQVVQGHGNFTSRFQPTP